jgi:3-hydroxyacyl-CoA dehydrogenase
MSEPVKLTNHDGVGVITVDNPPVNALSSAVLKSLESCLLAGEKDPAMQALVLIGGGRTFIAGADINEFLEVLAGGRTLADLYPFLTKMEDCTKPIVAAIHGSALGGGLEVAMAAHYRVAVEDAQLGQPEVRLGIIPGAGGTQRLPRLVGIVKAAEMCALGSPLRASAALESGIVDEIVTGDLLAGAIALAKKKAALGGPHPKTRDRNGNDKLGSPTDHISALTLLRAEVRKSRKNLNAPQAAIDAVEAAAVLPFDEGCRNERRIFNECLFSSEAKSLIHAFFAERAVAKIPGLEKVTLAPIKEAAIVGAGTMGAGIAMCFANAGIPVLLTDQSPEALDRGMKNIRQNYENSVKRGRITSEACEQRQALIRPQSGYDGFDTADIVVEAVFESLALKKEIFAALAAVAKTDCILASNTSTLNIDEIASASRPERVVGLHFFSPANVMRLVEVVRGKATSPDVIAAAMALAKKLGKVGVVVGNCFGFVGNRMMFPYMREAQYLVEEGATPEQVDNALTDFGMAMGIFAVDDMAGIDVAWRVRQEFKHLDPPGIRKPLVADQLYAMNRLGHKTGKGWYRYANVEHRKPIPDPEVHALIEKTAREAGIARRQISNEEIIQRTIFALINEGIRILDEGYALRAGDIDTIYLNGYGFPSYRGGPMWYADEVGLGKILDHIQRFRNEHGKMWEPAPLLEKLVAEGKTLSSWDDLKR